MDFNDIQEKSNKQRESHIGNYIIGIFWLDKQIGEGTFGKVMLATNSKTDEKVLIKRLLLKY